MINEKINLTLVFALIGYADFYVCILGYNIVY